MNMDTKQVYNIAGVAWIISISFFALKEIIMLTRDPYAAGMYDIFFGCLGGFVGFVILTIALTERKNPDFKNWR